MDTNALLPEVTQNLRNIMRVLPVVFISIACLLAACASDGPSRFDPTTPPEMYEYVLNVVDQKRGWTESGLATKDLWLPWCWSDDGPLGLCNVTNNGRTKNGDTVSSIVLHTDCNGLSHLSQSNFATAAIDHVRSLDLDSISGQEIAATFVRHDTLWLAVLSKDRERREMAVLAGKDRDSNGFWDGRATVIGASDLTGDGIKELFVGVKAGYDHYPRAVLAIDWTLDTVLWSYSVSGTVGPQNTFLVEEEHAGQSLLICGVASSGNAVHLPQMNDEHSYVIALTLLGELAWQYEVGEQYTNPMPWLIDFDSTDAPEILCGCRYSIGNEGRQGGILKVLNMDGQLIDSLDLGADRA
ncbi:MAG: hypothetical protein KKA42_13930, partial [candidate division Zixibacteria bacterium]|nr:hypothetical protein [candidate division Zixibacteria bacterium]